MFIAKIIAAIKNPKKAIRFTSFFLYNAFRKKRGTLFFVGMDPSGVFGLMYRGYKYCYGFEANPIRYDKLRRKYKNHSNIKLFNVAVAQYDGEIDFNISNNNNGASSSIGNFDPNWQETYRGKNIEMVKSIKVRCININNFCNENNIDFIDDYVSDIQGMDLEVLKTMKPLIDNKRIGTITCEVTKNDKRNIYADLPDNSEDGFKELLQNNYVLIARGWGVLKDNCIEKIPSDVWEMDCKWRLKK